MVPPATESLTQRPTYRRLPGRGRRTSGCASVGTTISTIWLADDHLLLRESVYGLSETYKRFYFRDIQAIIVRRSPRWIAWISVWTILTFLFFFCWVTAEWRGWAWPVFSGVCFVLTMIQLARGPSCVTYLVTAVQRELLGSLNTLRKARRVLKTLVPLIEEKQGKFELTELALPESQAAQIPRSPLRPAMTTAPVSAPIPVRISGLHLALFATTFLGGVVALWETIQSSWLTLDAAGMLLAVILVLSVIALVVQGKRRVGKPVAALTWTICVGYITAWILVYTIYSSIYSLQRASQRAARHEPPELVFDLKPASLRAMPGFESVLLVYGACSVVIGGAGIGSLFLARPRLKQPPPLPMNESPGPID